MINSTPSPALFPFNNKEDKMSRAAKIKDTIIGLSEGFITLILIRL
jgi:hypothetical protein